MANDSAARVGEEVISGFGEIVVGAKVRLFDTGDLVYFAKLFSLGPASQSDDGLSTCQTIFGGWPTGAMQCR